MLKTFSDGWRKLVSGNAYVGWGVVPARDWERTSANLNVGVMTRDEFVLLGPVKGAGRALRPWEARAPAMFWLSVTVLGFEKIRP